MWKPRFRSVRERASERASKQAAGMARLECGGDRLCHYSAMQERNPVVDPEWIFFFPFFLNRILRGSLWPHLLVITVLFFSHLPLAAALDRSRLLLRRFLPVDLLPAPHDRHAPIMVACLLLARPRGGRTAAFRPPRIPAAPLLSCLPGPPWRSFCPRASPVLLAI
jgi:hypothetical protein